MRHKPTREQWSAERLKEAIADFMQRHQISERLPTNPELLTLDAFPRHDLLNALHRYGGRASVAHVLDVPTPTRWIPNPLLHSQSALIAAVQSFARDAHLARMPRIPELRAAGRVDLANAIICAGGFHMLAPLCGLPWVHRRTIEERTVQ